MKHPFDSHRRSGLLLFLAFLVICSWLPILDKTATEQVEQGFQRALVSFASARALNAVISVAQGTQAAVEPAGVGLVFAPGEILDPVNDLVERFSNLMLIASVSFGVQKILISVGAFWGVSLMLSLTALAWSIPYIRRRRVSPWIARTLFVLLMIRFAIPVITLGSDWVFDQFLQREYEVSQSFIGESSQELDQLNPQVPPVNEPQNLLDRLRSWYQSIDIELSVEQLKASADRTVEHVINLMVIFVLQILVLPLLLLWILFQLTRRMFSPPRISPE